MRKLTNRQLIGIFSMYTGLNIWILCMMKRSSDLRTTFEYNWVKSGNLLHYVGLLLLISGIYFVSVFMIQKIEKIHIDIFRIDNKWSSWLQAHTQWKIWGMMMGAWFLFFLAFMPGTLMNDTVYILNNPEELTQQHPVIYILYTEIFYQIGIFFKNPNLGIALLSLTQMMCFTGVLSQILVRCYRKWKMDKIILLLTIYFSIMPIFPLYAVSAIKDTPFSIGILMFGIALYDRCEREYQFVDWLRYFISIFVIGTFRSNGMISMVLTIAWIGFFKRKEWMKELILASVIVILSIFLNHILMPANTNRYAQETFGMQIQQVAAVLVVDQDISQEDQEYLYRILPKERWEAYAPSCCDVLKWDDEFNREYFTKTKWQFVLLWARLLPTHFSTYAKAWIMETYGFWGIETRNREQYYVKDIYENTLGITNCSVLPTSVKDFIRKIYCNRYTLAYLSAGTALWILLLFFLIQLKKEKINLVLVAIPFISMYVTIVLATPIAFCFRYVFPMAVGVPIMIIKIIIDMVSKDIS